MPRGILFHEYGYDKDGMCLGGNCIIPTNQNHANIQHDFEKLVPELVAQEQARRRWSWRWRCWCAPTTRASRARPTYLDVKFVR